nr:MAG TPA: hypothetical protein [Caudoviricetes sp.]
MTSSWSVRMLLVISFALIMSFALSIVFPSGSSIS